MLLAVSSVLTRAGAGVLGFAGVSEAFKRDKDPRKINLGVGEQQETSKRIIALPLCLPPGSPTLLDEWMAADRSRSLVVLPFLLYPMLRRLCGLLLISSHPPSSCARLTRLRS